MRFRVDIKQEAWTNAKEQARWWAEHRSAEQAARWLEGLQWTIDSLRTDALLHPIAREAESFPYGLRQLNYGLGSKATHRILYQVRDEKVLVLSVRHLSQRDLAPEDL
ncbi:Plasmid stabilization system protein [Pseudobythopirellula maris]|uniref:Plasmid stabilization system protein n=1 Tax=Pseudobythopirellula maris TaxID=2527991 RepID=A0A5C5ZIX2_9BACT|nr:type II toxin-antitoxin system RelE/ParE family toxin [Pseudobythopirellula maris]TWT87314.1 Plasmid stabilization system protein [Pseudobythopirellula maris]